jgi:hypothetical protein
LADFPTTDTVQASSIRHCFLYIVQSFRVHNIISNTSPNSNMKVATILALIPAAFAVINNEVCSCRAPPTTLANMLSVAPQDRSRNTCRVQPKDHCWRQDQRALPRYSRERRQRVRCLIQPRPAFVLHRRPGTGHQGLGPGSPRHVPGREEEAHYPA